jgi:hypothetical protein
MMREKTNVSARYIETRQITSISPARQSEQMPAPHSPVERILRLQRTVGNQAVQRLVRSGATQVLEEELAKTANLDATAEVAPEPLAAN